MDLSSVNPDVIRKAALEHLSADEIIKACKSNKYFNQALCNNQDLWKALWQRDFSSVIVPGDYKKAYQEAYTILNNVWDIPEAGLLGEKALKIREASSHGWEKQLKEPYDKNEVLTLAAKSGQSHIVDEMIAKGAKKYEALLEAAKNGHKDIVDKLLELYPDREEGVFSWAAWGGHKDIMDEMLQLGATNYDDALYGAALGGHKDIVDEMLRLGATDYNKALNGASVGGHLDIVDQMLSLGATDIKNSLKSAALNGHEAIVKRLLPLITNGEDLDPALVSAAKEGHISIVKLLIKAGAHDDHGRALKKAHKNGYPAVAELLYRTFRK